MSTQRLFFVLFLTFVYRASLHPSTFEKREGNIALNDCMSQDLDILALYEVDFVNFWADHTVLFKNFIHHLSNQTSSSSRVLVARVVADYYIPDASDAFSSWTFGELDDSPNKYLSATFVEYNIASKIELVHRLFQNMRGVRQTSVHIGVIFVYRLDLSRIEAQDVSSTVQQKNKNSDVKIFVVMVCDDPEQEIIHLTNVVALSFKKVKPFDHILLMAMCKMCIPGWFMYKQNVGAHFLSCYKLDSHESMDWTSAMHRCKNDYNGFLVGIETVEEMSFLRKYLYTLIKNKGNTTNISPSNATVYIGLHRDLSNYAKRFKWLKKSGEYFPLVFHHWLPGEPSKGFTNAACGIWKFQNVRNYDETNNITLQTSSSESHTLLEGWADIECGSLRKSFFLCEVVLPQKLTSIKLKIAKETDFGTGIKNGNFLTFLNNIVSVSDNVANPEFLTFLRKTNRDFPIFDCEEHGDEQRYISYDMVCDFVPQCTNELDEQFCVNPRNILSPNLFCLSGQSLARTESFCDNIEDCADGSDENNCIHFPCQSVRCCDGSCLPLQWVNDGEVDCFICDDKSSIAVSDESSLHYTRLKNNETCALIYNNGTYVVESQPYDGTANCTEPEGPLDERLGKLEPANTCHNVYGQTLWAPKCVYIKDAYGGIIGCRNMSHLSNCESFPCIEGYVKCRDSYCIPQHYLLDGTADCPTGEDEQPLYIGQCKGHFACWDSKICLHTDLVCDGHADCPNRDDENGCQMLCPTGFSCTGGTITVLDYNLLPLDIRTFNSTGTRIKYLDLSGIDLSEENNLTALIKDIFPNVKVLILSNCKIRLLYLPQIRISVNYYEPFVIQTLDISHNMLQELFADDLSQDLFQYIRLLNASYNKHLVSIGNLYSDHLESLDLSHTGLSHLTDDIFIPYLKYLNISYTPISDFSIDSFTTKFALQFYYFDLRGTLIENFHSNFLHGLKITGNLYSDHFQHCCPQILGANISSDICHAPTDAISSCLDLLGLNVQRVLLWIVAVLAVLGNITVIVYRVIWDRSVLKTGYGLFVTNLGISDFIMGVYLFIIAGADHFYRDNYVLYDMSWRQCIVCKCAGFMATLSTEASTMFIFLIMLDRYLAMKYPFGQKRFSSIHKIITVILSWLLNFVLSLIPVVLDLEIYYTNAMCFGLPLTNTKVKGWEYSLGVFVIYNYIMLIITALGQYAIFRAMSENRIAITVVSASSSRRAKDILVAKHLSLIVMFNFLCWFPIGFMGLMTLGGHQISKEVYAWTTVFLLPMNSAVNPVLYTIPAIMARWEQFKYRDDRTLST